jgi:hypothetical protein
VVRPAAAHVRCATTTPRRRNLDGVVTLATEAVGLRDARGDRGNAEVRGDRSVAIATGTVLMRTC